MPPLCIDHAVSRPGHRLRQRAAARPSTAANAGNYFTRTSRNATRSSNRTTRSREGVRSQVRSESASSASDESSSCLDQKMQQRFG